MRPDALRALTETRMPYTINCVDMRTFAYSEDMHLNQPLHQFKAEFFKALAHPARIKMLEFLRGGERTVGEIQAFLEIEPSATSQQLAVLRAKGIVATRKEGSNVYYTVRDPLVFHLLDVARAIFNNQLSDTRDLLSQLAAEEALVLSGSN
jgi:DNA-binding transcriptional ArsR family regulator